MSTFQTALSGLQAASSDLQVMGNNIANANTVGFKESNAQFSDAYASAIAGTAASNGQIGMGTSTQTVAQNFSQGSIQTTSNPLDIAINGSGFFQLNYGGATVFSRSGQFQINDTGYIVDGAGAELVGEQAVNGQLTGANGPLQVAAAISAPLATSGLGITLNLNADSTPISGAINIDQPTTYDYSTTATVYDSLGSSALLTTYYALSSGSSPPTWNVAYSLSGTTGASGITSGTLGTIQFTTSGTVVSGTASGSITVPLSGWADGANASTINVNFLGSTSYSSPSSVSAITNNGYGVGELSSMTIAPDGTISGDYSNGQSNVLGMISLTNFAAPTQLQNLGNNYFAATASSGQPLTGQPGAGGLGVLQSSALEQSNVDLSTQLVDLIVAQQAYQANAQTIKTEQQNVQTLLQL